MASSRSHAQLHTASPPTGVGLAILWKDTGPGPARPMATGLMRHLCVSLPTNIIINSSFSDKL